MCRSVWVLPAWLVCALMSFAGCSERLLDPARLRSPAGEETSAVETSANALPETSATAAEAPRHPHYVPQTADVARRVLLQGLHDNHPDVFWDALPASYQGNVNELVRLFANRLHPEAWRWLLQIAG